MRLTDGSQRDQSQGPRFGCSYDERGDDVVDEGEDDDSEEGAG